MENSKGAAIVDKYIPGFSSNTDAKMAYGMTFKALCELPMFGFLKEKAEELFAELDALTE